MPSKPRKFEPEELVKVTLRIPKDMYEKIWKYAHRYGYSLNESAARLVASGIGDSELDRDVVWANKFLTEFQKSEGYQKLRDDFRVTLTAFLSKYYEKNPEPILTEIIAYAGRQFDYYQQLLDLENERLAKAIAGDNPEAQKKLMEFFEMMAWIWNWICSSSKSKKNDLETKT